MREVPLLARRVAGVPLPLFFAIGAVLGIVLAMTFLSIVRRSSSRSLAHANIAAVRVAPEVQGARLADASTSIRRKRSPVR